MKIRFLLGGPSRHPTGGYKMVYTYAGALARRGHQVTLTYRWQKAFSRYPMPGGLRRWLSGLYARPRWFPLEKAVRVECPRSLSDLEDGDIIVATAAQTAPLVRDLPDSKGEKRYFIQGYEDWALSPGALEETYRFGMRNIAVSCWLKELVERASGREAALAPNGVDENVFRVTTPIGAREPFSVGMLYHEMLQKGATEGLAALLKLRGKHPQLQAVLFGVPARPRGLPAWIEYIREPSEAQLCGIYNRCAIFLSPGRREGFGLTGAESLFCGCALATADFYGAREYAQEEHSALFCPPGAMAAQVERLLLGQALRIRLAEQGCQSAREKLALPKACAVFEAALLGGEAAYGR